MFVNKILPMIYGINRSLGMKFVGTLIKRCYLQLKFLGAIREVNVFHKKFKRWTTF